MSPFSSVCSGYIDAEEIKHAFKNLGVNIDKAEAEQLLKR